MTIRPDCIVCGHSYYVHNDYWDKVGTDGKTPIKGLFDGACLRCACKQFTPPDGWKYHSNRMTKQGEVCEMIDLETLRLKVAEYKKARSAREAKASLLKDAIDANIIRKPKWRWFHYVCPNCNAKLVESDKEWTGWHLLTCPNKDYEAGRYIPFD